MGIAERKEPSDNPAFVNMSAKVVLHEAVRICEAAGVPCDPRWSEIADDLTLPIENGALVSHDGWRPGEEKGETPDPLLAIFPLGGELSEEVRAATFARYLALADDYAGSPMLSAFLGAWAAMSGDRKEALRLLEEGYGKFSAPRFGQTLEYRADRFPEQPMAGPFFANIGGFALSLLLGFTGLQPGPDDPQEWARRDVMLPEGWDAIEVDRLWIHGRAMRLVARHGERATLEPGDA
jgi:hypothetical protein